ncbi:pYEATS domain-containing protein [Mesorhizobium sp. M0227]|uniref:pYEATS domain-containing protein n=1 Tax=Mesorhizobium sp. M0227 TaxID=2956922 RepID=UPI003337917B
MTAPLGAEISVTDGGFSRVASGVTLLDQAFSEGVYTVRWAAGERGRQWIVRLRESATLRIPEDVGSGASDGPPEDGRLKEIANAIAAQPTLTRGAEILVAVLATDDQTKTDLGQNIELRDPNGRRISRDQKRIYNGVAASWMIVGHSVAPGPFVLRYETFERKIVEQTVYAIERRRTVVLLSYAQTSVIAQEKGDARIRKRRGIDPARTTMVSLAAGTAGNRLAEAIATAETLLHKLRTRTAPLDPSVAAMIIDDDDPYLHLYAAAAVIAISGSAVERLTTVLSDAPGKLTAGINEATTLHNKLAKYKDWPDVRCLGWRLAADQPGALPSAPGLLVAPMLEIAWRWASGHSVGDPAMAVDPLIAATAARANPGAIPWLVAGTAPTRTGAGPATGSVSEIQIDLARLVDGLNNILSRSPEVAKGFGSREPIRRFDVSNIEPAAGFVIEAILRSGVAERWLKPDSALVRQLASSLATPLSSLAPSVRAAALKVMDLVESGSMTSALDDDPHKGRFGGSANYKGITLSLKSFEESVSQEILALRLMVASHNAGQPLLGPVTFYLHPTFTPSSEIVRVIDGQATFSCYAWGAFTIGVETSDGLRVELDLAEDKRLPGWFRGR